ncbi:MAG: hypothetical protein ACR2J3_11305 [Aridibacter sp.]
MNNTPNKFFTLLKIILALLFCLLISFGVYFASVPIIYAAWHCPDPSRCNSPNWLQWLVLFILISPVPIFILGAYLSRKMISTLTQNKFLRAVIFFGFAIFPILLWIGLVIYIVESAK